MPRLADQVNFNNSGYKKCTRGVIKPSNYSYPEDVSICGGVARKFGTMDEYAKIYDMSNYGWIAWIDE